MTDALFELLTLESRVDEYGTVRYLNGMGHRHRVHGPAVESPNGYRAWHQNGLLHRLDGPAIERPDGHRAWYINDWNLTRAQWQQAVASMEHVCLKQ